VVKMVEGKPLQFRNDSIAVGTTAVQLLTLVEPGENQVVSITNTSQDGSTVTIAQGQGQTAVSGAGQVLQPGQTYIESIAENFNPGNEVWSVVGSAAGATIAIFVRQNKQ
jgi:hypothetical protein